jgi:TonB family protein
MKRIVLITVVFFGVVRYTAALDKAAIKHFEAPAYSILAVHNRIEGTVEVKALIGSDGVVTNVTATSGHPLLAESVLKAVKEWSFVAQGTAGELIIRASSSCSVAKL